MTENSYFAKTSPTRKHLKVHQKVCVRNQWHCLGSLFYARSHAPTSYDPPPAFSIPKISPIAGSFMSTAIVLRSPVGVSFKGHNLHLDNLAWGEFSHSDDKRRNRSAL